METRLRTIAKAFTFRLIALSVTVPIVGWKIAIGIQLILLVAYYFHERFWMKINWGLDMGGRKVERTT